MRRTSICRRRTRRRTAQYHGIGAQPCRLCFQCCDRNCRIMPELSATNTFKLPGYVRADAALFYRRDAWRVQLNVNNLFDRAYYTGGSAGTFNYTLDPSRPRSVQLSGTYQF